MPFAARPVHWFTPLPPAKNGIADYAAILLRQISEAAPCICYCEDALAEAPEGVEVRDPLQAFRHLGAESRILHQIGNNRGHVFALEALRAHGGVTSLHDLSLLYVYELGMAKPEEIFGRMQSPSQSLGATYARHWKEAKLKTAANYILFDMVGEVLARSRGVIVHSEYARRKLLAVHGEEAARKVSVIPHFAKPPHVATSEEARERLGIDQGETLVLTSGFATKAKRFDWLIEALDQSHRRGHRFRWIHAGEERADEYALTRAIEARPNLKDCCSVTGYLSEEALDNFIAAADLVVNLRFPSVGESSGTLARAFSAGRCCIVNDTAAYAEIPRDVVVHLPVFDTVGALVRAFDHLLGDRTLRDVFGVRARHFARTTLSLDSVARRYLDVIAAAYDQPVAADKPAAQRGPRIQDGPIKLSIDVEDGIPQLSAILGPAANDFELTLWFSSAGRLAETVMQEPALMNSMLGPHVEIDSVRFLQDAQAGEIAGNERIGILVAGRACG